MKRPIGLVDYAGSEEDSDSDASDAVQNVSPPRPGPEIPKSPPKKMRKLPPLPGYLLPQVQVDNPALHQGRRRTTPHVEGQFAAYVYVPLLVERRSRLYKLLLRVFEAAKRLVPSLYPIGFSECELSSKDTGSADVSEGAAVELHLSLTRPTYLRAHQRADFKKAVQDAAKATRRFSASFATFSELTNDEKTRTFLTLEVGAGHEEFKALSEHLTPILKSLRQKEFYQDPRFHASIAWALLDGARAGPRQGPVDATDDGPERATTPTLEGRVVDSGDGFPTIPCFPRTLVPALCAEFARELVESKVGAFDAEEVRVRIGKEVSQWRLRDQ
ncbi:hypothetical protein BN946_scf184771.g7 [Trametes cinnabarina]|uniref:U6 snRNA phosphodiesterase 1 n=1 Tax=Pycnoporus cinnabarinus TaxID=5643 RepID=A0A060SK40_PYCCI|nr:hypothetical protein BN946_scf184771.g7 [Trametes cinnabarina]